MTDELIDCAGGADRFAVVDTETTGVYSTDRIVEIAIITVGLDGTVLDKFDTLVQPCRDVSATHIHGITASMVADAPTFEEIAGDVAIRLHGACLVGHNVPFDRRMLAAEFLRLGEDLVAPHALDTYEGSGLRLTDACASYGIDLAGAHRASNDARATTALFLRLRSTCGSGGPAAAPVALHRLGRVRTRDDVAPAMLVETPLLAYLLSQLTYSDLAVRSQQYLEVVGRALADLHLDRNERAELGLFARELGMSEAETIQGHRRFVHALIDVAIEDGVVTDDEYDSLVRVGAALEVDQERIERRVAIFRSSTTQARLIPGLEVVFTGEHRDHDRDQLHELAIERGLEPKHNVSKSTGVVFAADPESTSGKAAKARRFGIPVVGIDAFLEANIGDLIEGSASVEGSKVVMCPDCHVTWTVPATTRAHSSKRCAGCAEIAAANPLPPARRAAESNESSSPWPAPVVEWLTCRSCRVVWARQVVQGRKPHQCPACAGVPQFPPPTSR